VGSCPCLAYGSVFCIAQISIFHSFGNNLNKPIVNAAHDRFAALRESFVLLLTRMTGIFLPVTVHHIIHRRRKSGRRKHEP
jgi:hypothetical protein